MNKLRKQLARFRAAAELALSDASKAIEAEDFELAETKQTEADAFLAKATTIEKQIKSLEKIEEVENEDEAEQPEAEKDAMRLPFSEDNSGESDEENTVEKAVNILRFGNIDAQTNVLLKELYGADYNQKRVHQQGVFNKYLRTGRFATIEDERLLKTAILLPEQVRDGVKQDVSYKAMKATLQEVAGELGGYVVNNEFAAIAASA